MKLAGYAARYNSTTVIAGLFEETIAPGAFREAIGRDDVRALWNHDPNVVLGRTKSGTLTLREDSKGLYYEVDLNEADPIAVGVGARVARRDITGSSFHFDLDPADDEWYPPAKPGGLPRRILRRLGLQDVSPVTFPAYPEASVQVARADAGSIAERERLRLAIEKAKAWHPSTIARAVR
jgi:HK97 family phage prohead protease